MQGLGRDPTQGNGSGHPAGDQAYTQNRADEDARGGNEI